MKREWLDNPFWENETHTVMKAILRMEDEDSGRVTTQVMTIEKGSEEDPNPDWQEVIDQIGVEKIDANTNERFTRLAQEEEARRLREQEVEQAKKLEQLFNAKLQAFEIDEVKHSTNRALKARLRRAKTIIEVNVYAMMIVMESIEDESQ